MARQAPLAMGFPRQEYWSVWPFPSSVDLPDPGIEPESPALAGGFFITEPPSKLREMAEAAAPPKSLQSCPTPCSPPGSSIPGILQARILEWVAIAFSRGSS